MILYTELGCTYIKNNFIYVKKSWRYIPRYIKYAKDVVKIEKDYIKLRKNINIKIKLNNLIMFNLLQSNENKIFRESSLAITNNNISWNDIAWAMKIEDKRIIKYDSLRTNGVYDEITKTPQKYLINKVRVHHDIDRIYIRYDIEDAVIVYYFINIWNTDYLYEKDKIEIMIGDEIIDWDWIKTVRIEYIFKKIIENNRASIRLVEEPLINNKYNISGENSYITSFKMYIMFTKNEKFFKDEHELISRWCDDNWEIEEFEKKDIEERKNRSLYDKIITKIKYSQYTFTFIRKPYSKYKRWRLNKKNK